MKKELRKIRWALEERAEQHGYARGTVAGLFGGAAVMWAAALAWPRQLGIIDQADLDARLQRQRQAAQPRRHTPIPVKVDDDEVER
jgi:hypothetical protein